jgi:hypothetical protein
MYRSITYLPIRKLHYDTSLWISAPTFVMLRSRTRKDRKTSPERCIIELPPNTHLVFRKATIIDFKPRVDVLLAIKELKHALHTSKYAWNGRTALNNSRTPITSFDISIVTLDGYVRNIGEWQLKLRLD